MLLRAARSNDAPALARVYAASENALRTSLGLPLTREPPPAWFDDARLATIVVATPAGDVAGPCEVIGFVECAGAELRALYVDPSHWGTGVATALHRRASACTSLEVIAANARARRFYEREGWTLAGEGEPHDFDGTLVPFVRYRRNA